MGLTHVTVSLSNLRTDTPAYENEFLVDTGAIDCLAPSKALFAAGIAVEGKDVYELANGEIVEYPYGFARVSFMVWNCNTSDIWPGRLRTDTGRGCT